MESSLFWKNPLIFIERLVAFIITLPIIGLLAESFGVWSDHTLFAGLVRLVEEPSILRALVLSVVIASVSLMLSMHFACGYVERLFKQRNRDWSQLLILAMPHTALALAIILLFSSDGIFSRWTVSIFGLAQPDYLFPRDGFGLGTLLSLVVKETIFLTALGLSLVKKLPVDSMFMVGRQAGFSQYDIWRYLLWPQIIQRMKPALLVIFVFGLTNLEVAAILGPDQPQFLAVRVYHMLHDPNILTRQAGALGSLILLVLAFLSAWVISLFYRVRLLRDRPQRSRVRWSVPIERGLSIFVISALTSLLIWTVFTRWPAYQIYPVWSLRLWQSIDLFSVSILHTCILGFVSSILSMLLAVSVLEQRLQKNEKQIHMVWWCCLWIPTLSFSSGLLAWMLLFGIAPSFIPVLVAHVLIGTPFALIMLAESWYARDQHLALVVAQSGRSKFWAMSCLWIPKMSDTFLLTFAVCFSVSCSLYTQTAVLGGGRVTTLMTELVAFGSGDRRLAALVALINTLLPLCCFAVVIGLNRLLWSNRIGMQGGGDAIVR